MTDAVDEDEAVALWNNADFQAAISELGVARGRLLEAGLLRNPVFSVLFPLGPKQLEFTLLVPLESSWLRPGRVAAAELDCERIAALLVKGGVDLVHDVRVDESLEGAG